MDAWGGRLSRRRQRVTGVIIRNDRILLIKRIIFSNQINAPKILAIFWTMPGGGLKPQETRIEGLRREIRNEVGFDSEGERPLFEVENVPMPPGFPPHPHPLCQDEHYFLIDPRDAVPQLGKELKQKMAANPCHRYVLDWVPLQEFPKPNLRERIGPRRLAEELSKMPSLVPSQDPLIIVP